MKTPAEYSLLIVEDETDLRELMAADLRRQKFNVVEADNGVKALEICGSQLVHLIISDINMPGGNGIDLLKNLRSAGNTVPVILFLSGYGDVTPESLTAMGANQVLSKPFDRKTLNQTIQSLLFPKF